MSDKVFYSRAPVRANPAGGGSDCPPHCNEVGGAVINFAFTHYASCDLIVHRDHTKVTIISEDFETEVRASALSQLEIDGTLDLLKGIARRMNPAWGFTLRVRSDVPPGSGLGSSGAVGVATVAVFDAATGTQRTNFATGMLANAVERDDLKMPGGSQDCLGAALGGMNFITYKKGGDVSAEKISITDSFINTLETRGVLVYTGEAHVSNNIHNDIKTSYYAPESTTLAAMEGLHQTAITMKAHMEEGNIEAVARGMSDNWKYHKQLHESCHCDRLQQFYDVAAPYISGGCTLGAGGGGTLLFIARPDQKPQLCQALEAIGGQMMPLEFTHKGVEAGARI